MSKSDEPLSEATLSLYLRRLVQDEIDRSFKLGLSAPKNGGRRAERPKPDAQVTGSPAKRGNGGL